ncbi:tRNA pseudouridine(38-40) synthase TruA [Haloparvum sp. AD34]
MRAFRIAYDGRHYNGFQRQPSVPTVEDALLDALREQGALGPADAVDTPSNYAAAGRTDAGVSAIAQTVAFDAPDWLTPRALNGALPGGVRAWAAADVPEGFHATHHATRRTYRYYLFAPPVDGADATAEATAAAADDPTALPAPAVDDERVHTALGKLSGRHDFANFTTDESGTERDVTATATRSGPFLVLEVSAGGFPREFVRRLVTLVRAVGTGDASLAKVDRALDPEPLPGHEGIGPATPEPLVLWDVAYEATPEGLDDAIEFDVDDEARESALQVFGERHVSARVDAQVLGAMREGLESADDSDDSGD